LVSPEIGPFDSTMHMQSLQDCLYYLTHLVIIS